MRRIIKTNYEARQQLAEGARKLAEAVGSTFGPYGKNFFLDKKNTVTNDGVSVAREFQPDDEIESRGATAIREAAIKTVDISGDGTSTAIILGYAIYERISHYLGDDVTRAKMTPSEIVRKIETEKQEIIQKLEEMATPITSEEELVQSAIVSTESKELGEIIGKAQWKVGKDGYLLAEPTAERQSSVEMIHGIRIDNGFGTSQIINNQEKQTLEIEDVQVLLTSYTIKDIKDWQNIMRVCEQVAKDGQNKLVVIARAWTDETVRFCLENINKGGMSIYPLSAPYEDMQERFKDLVAVLGGKFYDSESSRLKDVVLSDLGFATKVTAKRFEAILAGKNDNWTAERIAARTKELEDKYNGSESEFEKKKLKERAAQLNNGFAIVKVGSPSDMERQRLFDKAEDAVHAVRAALQEGTVPGGGLALKQIAEILPDDYFLKMPIQEPYKLLMDSAPKDFTIESWVRDPLKVVKVSLEQACAAASTFATVAGVITAKKSSELDELFRTRTQQ